MAIDINDTRVLHVAALIRDGLRNQSKIVAASRVLVLGASYREDVGDTQIKIFFAAGYEVKGLGRGHMKRLQEEVVEK